MNLHRTFVTPTCISIYKTLFMPSPLCKFSINAKRKVTTNVILVSKHVKTGYILTLEVCAKHSQVFSKYDTLTY